MSQNYLEFSEVIRDITPEEKAWFIVSREKANEDGIRPGFAYELDRRDLYLYEQEMGDVEGLAQFLQTFLITFRPYKVITFTWAETCSRPRVGEFGGGWCAVSAEKIIFGNTWEEADKAADRLMCAPGA